MSLGNVLNIYRRKKYHMPVPSLEDRHGQDHYRLCKSHIWQWTRYLVVTQNQDRIRSLLEGLAIPLSPVILLNSLESLKKPQAKSHGFHLWSIYMTLSQRNPFSLNSLCKVAWVWKLIKRLWISTLAIWILFLPN